MEFKIIEKLKSKNKKEIKNIKNNHTKSQGAKDDLIEFINKENELISNFDEQYYTLSCQLYESEKVREKSKISNKSINEIRDEIVTTGQIDYRQVKSQINDIKTQIDDIVDNVYQIKEGKKQNVFSAFIGQVDKKIHNWWFKKDARWNKHEDNVYEKYYNSKSYFMKKMSKIVGISSAVIGLLLIIPSLGGFLPYALGGVSAGFAYQGFNILKVIIDKKYKHKPLLERNKKLLKGNYIENISNAIYMKKSSERVCQNINELLVSDINNVIVENEQRSVQNENETFSIDEINDNFLLVEKPDINNYGTFDVYKVTKIDKSYQCKMTFVEAISILRDKRLHTEDEWEEAMTTIANVFGRGPKKNSYKNVKRVLNDFSKTEKLIAEYGRKIRSGNASEEDKLIHQALIYHLAKYDVINNFDFDTLEDDINNFIADEALRYTKDLEAYQKTLYFKK